MVLVSSGPSTNLPGAMPFVPGGMIPCHFTCLFEAAPAVSEARERRRSNGGGAGALEQRVRAPCPAQGGEAALPVACRKVALQPRASCPQVHSQRGEDVHLGRWAGVNLYPSTGERTVFKSTRTKTDPKTRLGSNPKVRSLFPESLADTDFFYFFCPVVLLSWHHTDSFLALVLSRNSSVASVVFLYQNKGNQPTSSICFFKWWL